MHDAATTPLGRLFRPSRPRGVWRLAIRGGNEGAGAMPAVGSRRRIACCGRQRGPFAPFREPGGRGSSRALRVLKGEKLVDVMRSQGCTSPSSLDGRRLVAELRVQRARALDQPPTHAAQVEEAHALQSARCSRCSSRDIYAHLHGVRSAGPPESSGSPVEGRSCRARARSEVGSIESGGMPSAARTDTLWLSESQAACGARRLLALAMSAAFLVAAARLTAEPRARARDLGGRRARRCARRPPCRFLPTSWRAAPSPSAFIIARAVWFEVRGG